MPIVSVSTNVSRKNIKEKCAENFALEIATILNKPPNSVVVTINSDQEMFAMGSSEPAIVLTIATVADFTDKDVCRKVCNDATTAILKYIDIQEDRIRVILQPLQPEHAGCGVAIGTVWDLRQQQKK